mmetsp:Transcript_55907/g.147804  ORF Transcript_55907/g.147804 Transcript_55907/m.147804 type:complete len:227 (-) Transcript_55907:527-1207(-)
MMYSAQQMGGNQFSGAGQGQLSVVLQDLAARFVLTCPPEEFESFNRIFFSIEQAHWFYVDNCQVQDPTLPKMGLREFSRKFFDYCPMLKQFQSSIEEHLQNFSSYKIGVPVYGAIILNTKLDKCLLVKGYGNSWGFPKGKVNKNENAIDCAAREVYEEVGFDVSKLIAEDDTILYKNQQNKQTIQLYIAPGVSEETCFAPTTRGEIRLTSPVTVISSLQMTTFLLQ